MEARDILIRPIVTEKSTALMEQGKYTFRVPLAATKIQIRQAVEQIFKVKVQAVNTMRYEGKLNVWAAHRGAAAIGRRQSLHSSRVKRLNSLKVKGGVI